jgi:hypothetical protein
MPLRHTRTAAAIAVLLGLLAAILVLRASASAQDSAPRTITFTELERGATFTHIRNTKGAKRRANLQGDVIAFTNPLADPSGRRIGKLSVSCTTTTGARNFLKSTLTCVAVAALADGTLMLQTNTGPAERTTHAAVTGGTGAYANARGVYVSTDGRSGSQATITLAD